MLEDWCTNVEGETGEDGTYSTRAFLGDFVISASAADVTASADVSVARSGDEADEVTVRLAP